MRVLYSSRSGARIPAFPGEPAFFEVVLAESDFVSVHVPLTAATHELFGEAAFRRMRPHAIFVNTSRGGVVEQEALRRALIEGWIGGAALDVTTPEPLPPDHPLLTAPNLVITPHLGSATEQTREYMATLAVDGLLDVLAGRRPEHLVNPEVWSAGAGVARG